MLSTEAIDAVWALADRCDANNFVVAAMPDTPLSALVIETGSGKEFNIVQPDGSYTPDVVAITAVANAVNPLLGENCHTDVLKDIASGVANAIRGHITVAKTVVAPAVEALALAVAEDMANRTVSGLLGMEVIAEVTPDLARNEHFANLLTKFAEVPFSNPQLILSLPDQSPEELRELIKTGSNTIDQDIETWLAAVGDSFLCGVYQQAFQCIQRTDSMGGPSFRSLVTDRVCGRDNTIAIFLLANRLVEEPLIGTEMNPSAYEDLVSDFRSQAGAQLCRLFAADLQSEKDGFMIMNYTSNKVVVNDTVYRKWIDAGGDNELLFGNLRQRTPYMTIAEIDAHADELRKEWSSFCNITTAIEMNKRFSNIKESLSVNFSRLLQEETQDQDGADEGVGLVRARFETLLNEVCEADTLCLYSLSLKLVCRSRFPTTDAEEILTNIEVFKKQNPKLDVADVATVVYLKHIAKWVASMMVIQAI